MSRRPLGSRSREVAPGDMDIAGWRLHPLKGARKGEWSVWVSGNWRVTFRFDGNNPTDVNYEDDH